MSHARAGKLLALRNTFLLAMLVFATAEAFLLFGGGSTETNFLSACAIAAQAVGGVLIVSSLTRNPVSTAYALSIGLPVGMCTALLSATLLLHALSWVSSCVVPLALGVLSVVFSRRTAAIRLPRPMQFPIAAGLAAPLIISAGQIWKLYPLSGNPWWRVNLDDPLHASFAATLAAVGPLHNLAAIAGGGIRYHWFADAWIANIAQMSTSNVYWAMSRPLLIVTMIVVVNGLWALSGLVTQSVPARCFGVFLGTCGSILTVRYGEFSPFTLDASRPTFQFGLMLFLALSVMFLRLAKEPPSLRGDILIAFLAFASIGSRITNVLLIGLCTITVVGVALASKGYVREICRLACAVSIGSVAGLILLILPPAGSSYGNAWLFGYSHRFADLMGMTPFYSSSGFAIGVIASLVAACLGGYGLIFFFLQRSHRNLLIYWLLAIAVAGIIGVTFTHQNGDSQETFIQEVQPFILLGGGLGGACAIEFLATRYRAVPGFRKFVLLLTVVACAIGGISVWAWPHLFGFRFDGIARTLFPFAFLGAGVLLSVAARTACLPDLSVRRTIMATSWTVSCMVLAASVLGTAFHVMTPADQPNITDDYVMSDAALNAGQWVKDHTPIDTVMATNRQCTAPGALPPNCPSTAFTVSALASRQALFEGRSFSVTQEVDISAPRFQWARDLMMNSYEFGLHPTKSELNFLWSRGVRYFWVDHLVPHAATWSPYASVVYENSAATILKLHPPSP